MGSNGHILDMKLWGTSALANNYHGLVQAIVDYFWYFQQTGNTSGGRVTLEKKNETGM